MLPEIGHSWWHYKHRRRITSESQRIAELIQAGDSGYDELVRLVPSLWNPNISPALKGILAQEKRDRVADLCAIYVACEQKRNHKEAIARVLGELGDPRASAVLVKDLESVWKDLALISCDNEIAALGSLKAREAGDLLLKIIRNKYSWEGSAWRIKEEAFVALGKIGDERALPDAAGYLEDGADWYINKGAMNYLTRIGNTAAKEILIKAFQRSRKPELALCLVQIGETSVLPDVRIQLNGWLDDFAVHGWGGNWDFFYCIHALIMANDTEAISELRRALVVLKKGDAKTREYIRDDASGYSVKLLLDKSKSDTLVSDLELFLKTNSPAIQ